MFVRISASDIATLTGGRLVGPDTVVDGVTQDSRTVEPGQLFVPVVDARDGHDFIPSALERGAAAYLSAGPTSGGTAVVVDDTVAALTALAAGARARLPEQVVGITGSAGKTSTKDLVAAVLGTVHRTHASHRSFNNELGVPITLLNAPDATEALVVEMGARNVGNIAHLCAIARPTIGVVTLVGPAHIEIFGSLAAIAATKGELVESLPPTGTAVLNIDNPYVADMATRTRARVLSYGDAGEVRARDVVLDEVLRGRFVLETPWGRTEVRLGARGVHNVHNALAAAAVGLVSGVPLEAVAEGLTTTALSPLRMDLRRTPAGALVLDDSYNANPLSMEAALRALVSLDGDRHRAVLGVMAELGEHAAAEHAAIGKLVLELGVDAVALAEPAYGLPVVDDIDAAAAWVGPMPPGEVLLVKGSRVAGLDRLADRLVGP